MFNFFNKGSDKSVAETQRLNEELENRHYEFISNCDGGKGDPTACHSYGEWLAAVDQDYEKAAATYKQNCAEKNYAASCFNLGRLHLSGKGVEQNDAEALKLFEKACAGNHMTGCHHVGTMYLSAMGVEKDTKKAIANFDKACELGDANSCYRISSLYLSTKKDSSLKRDPVKAKEYLEKACHGSHAPACHNLAVMYKKGDEGITKSEEKYEEYRKMTKDLIERAGGPGIQIS